MNIKNKIIYYSLYILTFLIVIEIFAFIILKLNDLSKNNDIVDNSFYTKGKHERLILVGRELSEIKHNYKAFVGWNARELKGEYINIDENGFRKTQLPENIVNKTKVHFFGGSTMWGYGVRDSSTIPSIVADRMKLETINYGQQGYNSRQELNLLINHIDNINENDIVIFYDGFNDSFNSCNNQSNIYGHYGEDETKKRLELFKKENTYRLILLIPHKLYQASYFKNLSDRFTNRIKQRKNKKILKKTNTNYKEKKPNLNVEINDNTCFGQERIDKISNSIKNNWEIADKIVNSKKANFFCILQPLQYTQNYHPTLFNENTNKIVKKMYLSITSNAKDLKCFRDLSNSKIDDENWFDRSGHVYYEGNLQIANHIINLILKIK